MKAKELIEKTDDELLLELDKLEKEYKDLKFKKVTGVIENPLRLRAIRRDIARIKTIVHMNELERLKQEFDTEE
jgi:large subunit ribosomal protein L29